MKNFVWLLLPLFLSACSTSQIIHDSEYKYSEAAFKFSDPEKALTEFPKKEEGGFVTSIEKSWLGLWADKTNQKDLLRQTRTLDARNYISLSREAEYFFFAENEDGYIPAEHEVIVMHLISSMYFLRNNQRNEARVEAKQASYFLESIFMANQKQFDDPGLRIWLASIWASLGEWNEAQVDLRKAYELSRNKALLSLIDQKKPPAELTLIFEGAGPQVDWQFGVPLPSFSQKEDPPHFKITYSTLPWFQRHEERNTLIRDKISKSRYMSQYYGIQLSKNGEETVGFVSANTVRAAAVIAGTTIAVGGLYLTAAILSSGGGGTGGGELLGLPFIGAWYVGKTLWDKGNKIDENFKSSSHKIENIGKEDLKTFRFVRFMPSWISLVDSAVVSATGKDITFTSQNSASVVHFLQKY
ncbi:MAG: hypothetical protein ACXWRE_13775 [Pseudobdellovibrionaceae bacterium]